MKKLISATAAAVLLLATLGFLAAAPQQTPQPPNPAEAARLNNLGAAYMNQQLFEKGLKSFEQAAALDPKLEIAKLNQGIALVNLGRIDPAKQILEDAVKVESQRSACLVQSRHSSTRTAAARRTR